jgi:hypothetical protein
MLEAALAGSALREIRILRFRNLVLPGDALELRAASRARTGRSASTCGGGASR